MVHKDNDIGNTSTSEFMIEEMNGIILEHKTHNIKLENQLKNLQEDFQKQSEEFKFKEDEMELLTIVSYQKSLI